MDKGRVRSQPSVEQIYFFLDMCGYIYLNTESDLDGKLHRFKRRFLYRNRGTIWNRTRVCIERFGTANSRKASDDLFISSYL